MKYLITVCFFFIAVTIHAQSPLAGNWDTRKEHTIIKISVENDTATGKIFSSDNDLAIGKTILKDLKKQGNKWAGKLFAAKRKKWVNVELTPSKTQLDLLVSAGFTKKKIVWRRAKE